MDFDREKAAISAIVRAETTQIDYLALYPCLIVGQNADSTLELLPDDQRIPQQSQVPIRTLIPGSRIFVAPDPSTYALLGWAAGDPTKPYALLMGGITTKFEIAGADDFVALAAKVDARIETIRNAVNGHAGISIPSSLATVAGTTVKVKG